MTSEDAKPPESSAAVLRWRERALECLDFPLGRVLDYGCGDGTMLVHAARLGAECYGVDVRAGALAEARTRAPDATLRLCGITDPIPFPDAYFDTVLMIEVLEHVPDEGATLREIARVLRLGGRLVLTTPHRGLLTFLDVGNVKFAFPRAHRFVHRVLRREPEYYEKRFVAGAATGLIGDISVSPGRRAWHRHYTIRQVLRFVPESLELECRAVYFPAMRALMLLRKGIVVLTRGRMARARSLLLTIERRMSRVRSHWGDQLVIRFVKRQPRARAEA